MWAGIYCLGTIAKQSGDSVISSGNVPICKKSYAVETEHETPETAISCAFVPAPTTHAVTRNRKPIVCSYWGEIIPGSHDVLETDNSLLERDLARTCPSCLMDRHFLENLLFGQAKISIKNFQLWHYLGLKVHNQIFLYKPSSSTWLKSKLPLLTHTLSNVVG